MPKRSVNICTYRHLYMTVHSNIVHNSQEVETTQMSIIEWMSNVCHCMDVQVNG